VTFEQQFHNSHHHVTDRPSGGKNNEGENKHLLGSFTLRLEQKLAREIVKFALGGFSLIVRS